MIRVTRSAVIDAPIERVWAVLRDFNSHAAWHPAVARSEIEDGAPPDQVGCVRSFDLADGHRIREQLLALIYDGLGRDAVEENLAAIAACGHWVSYGQASGPLDPVAPERLAEKSLTWSRPVVFHYTATRAALVEVAGRTLDAVRRGVLRVEVRHRYPLAEAAEAHRALEERRTVGPVVLRP